MKAVVLVLLWVISVAPQGHATHIDDEELFVTLRQSSFPDPDQAWENLVLILHYGKSGTARTRAVANLIQYVPRQNLDRPLFRQVFNTLYLGQSDAVSKAELKAALQQLNLWRPRTVWEQCKDALKLLRN